MTHPTDTAPAKGLPDMLTNWRKMLGATHGKLIFGRRVRVLVEMLGRQLRPNGTMLDVGTGDGDIARRIGQQVAGTHVHGIDIMLRPKTHIPVELFDGERIPQPDNSADAVTFVDVLHHTDDPSILIKEAARVARGAVVIKDHLSENRFDHLTLRAMDWVGNAPHGVVLPYNYASRDQWMTWFEEAGLTVDTFETNVPLYPFPLSLVFGRKLHFVARLIPKTET